MYYNDLYKTAEFITISRILPLVKAGFGHNFFNMNRLCVISALRGEIPGLTTQWIRQINAEPVHTDSVNLNCSKTSN